MASITQQIKMYNESYRQRKIYNTISRYPFYDLAAKYLPINSDSIVLDIGCGNGDFDNYLDLATKYKNLYLLDGNPINQECLSKQYNFIQYIAPGQLPFDNETVSFIHCSHMIEHLSNMDLYQFIIEMDRVLSIGGYLVISTPLLWANFYDDLSHIKPYTPEVLKHYLCDKNSKEVNRTRHCVSNQYDVKELVYRYRYSGIDEGWSSTILPFDLLIKSSKIILQRMGFGQTYRNGYTMVLMKGPSRLND